MINKNGTYVGKAVEVTVAESGKKKTPYVGVIFQVTEGEFAGQRIRWEGYLTDATQERTFESLMHCGWQGDDISVFAEGKLSGIDTNEVDLVVEMEPYEKDGQTRESPKVQWVNRKGGGVKFMGDAVDPAKAKMFGAKYRGLALSVRAKMGAPKSTAQSNNHGPSAPQDDEIPF